MSTFNFFKTPEEKKANEAEQKAVIALSKFTDAQLQEQREIDCRRNPVSGRIATDDIGAYTGDDTLNVSFSTEKVLNKSKTIEADGIPVYEDIEFITITSPNDKYTVIHQPVTAIHQWRFPREYEAFKSGVTGTTGTPLSECGLSEADIKALADVGVYTAEQAATTTRLPTGVFHAKRAAERYLEGKQAKATNDLENVVKKQGDMIEKLVAELAKQKNK